ncbi:MAG: glycosyl hydrolase [Polyangia bacterium]
MPNSKLNTPPATLPRGLRDLHLAGLLLMAAAVGNCSNSEGTVNRPDSGVAGSGGTSATGGVNVLGGTTTGGTTAGGGTITTGGVTTTGGVSASVGSTGSGGSVKPDAGLANSGGAVAGGVTAGGGSGQIGGTISAGGTSSTDTGAANRDAGDADGRPNADAGGATGGGPSTGGATGTGGATRTGQTTSTGGTAGMGGTTGAGGATGAGGTTNTGGVAGSGGNSIAGCTAVPVVPNATQQTRNVLCYLHGIYGNGILSGQEEDNNDNGMNTVFAATGKYPAIRAFDVNNSEAPTQCVAHWNNGGLCMFGYHMGINGGTYNTKTNIANVLTAGTAENTSFNADLDRIAQFVEPLKTAGGVAILRLFHEAGAGCAWFWWSMGTSAQWQSLFKYAFNYLTATKGLNNVLFLAPLCQHPTTDYNPGAQYIDFGGADNYVAAGDTEPMTSIFQQAETAFPNMMVALHECGTIPDPDQLKSTGTKWLLFNVWANPYFNSPYNTTAHLQAVYSNPYVITRDKLPSFK